MSAPARPTTANSDASGKRSPSEPSRLTDTALPHDVVAAGVGALPNDAPGPTGGAIVLCGREVLRYEKVDGDERAPQSLVRHGVALFGSPPREPWGRLLQLLPSGGVRDVRHLHDDEAILGREEGDLVFSDDAFMSRRHAQIAWDGQRAMLADLGSSNGTFLRLNGPTAVKHGDHLRMGDQLFRIELRR